MMAHVNDPEKSENTPKRDAEHATTVAAAQPSGAGRTTEAASRPIFKSNEDERAFWLALAAVVLQRSTEMGSGKTTWSVYSLPSFVGATHGLLYYPCTGDATFEQVELRDSSVVTNRSGLFDHLSALKKKLIANFGPNFEEVFTRLRSAAVRALPDVQERDSAALRIFFTIVGDAFLKRGDDPRAGHTCTEIGNALKGMATKKLPYEFGMHGRHAVPTRCH
jgi:hypothetical protein